MKREISKTPKAPPLSEKDLQHLDELLFIEDQVPKQADLLFVFGVTTSFQEAVQHLQALVDAHIASTILFTGGISPYSDIQKALLPEAERLHSALTIPPNIHVLLETQSQNTLDNVRFGLKTCLDMPIESIVFMTRNFHSRRAYATLRSFLKKDVKLYSSSFTPYYETTGLLEKGTWQHCPEFVSRVWGEYLRLKHYGERGDILFGTDDEEIGIVS